MVEQLANLDVDLYRRSYGACLVYRPVGDAASVQVLYYKNIEAVVACPPCPTSMGRDEWAGWRFVGEKIGLDVSWISALDDDGEVEDEEEEVWEVWDDDDQQ